MLRIALKVQYGDGREQLTTVAAPDCIAFERHFDKPATEIVGGRLEYLWWTTWHSLHRAKSTAADFDTWLEDVVAIVDDESTTTDIVPLESEAPTS